MDRNCNVFVRNLLVCRFHPRDRLPIAGCKWVLLVAIFLVLLISSGLGVSGAVPGRWLDVGPGPTTDGQVEHVARVPGSSVYENDVVGGVNRILPHPTDPNIMYITTVGGGVWKSTNAQATPPSWRPLTDNAAKSLSMVGIALDHHRPDTIIAGFGTLSSWYRLGGDRLGILRSDDAGETWRLLSDPLLTGTDVRQLFIHGDTLLACTSGTGGIIRSIDGGATWMRNPDLVALSYCYDMAFKVPATAQGALTIGFAWMDGGSGSRPPGLYRTTDGGATWINTVAEPPSFLLLGPSYDLLENAKVRIHPTSGRVVAAYVLTTDEGNAHLVYNDADGAPDSWTTLPLPQTTETGGTLGTNPEESGLGGEEDEGEGDRPGGQGDLHFSMSLHPEDHNYIFVGGDRQSLESNYNSVAAENYSGRLFVCIISGSTTCYPFTHGTATTPGTTAHKSSPHADSRDMQADAAGNIVECDDGGIYRRTNPLNVVRANNNLGDWYSMIGNLSCTEGHDVAYDPVSDVFVFGAQDTGTHRQNVPGHPEFFDVTQGDGGDVVAAALTATRSVQYSGYYYLVDLERRTYDASNTQLTENYVAFSPYNSRLGSGAYFSFKTSMAINRFNSAKLFFHGTTNLYESSDSGATVAILGTDHICDGSSHIDGIVYGGRKDGTDYQDILYCACVNRHLVVRSPLLTVGPTALHRFTLPASLGTELVSLVEDPENANVVFVAMSPHGVVQLQGLATTDLATDVDLSTVNTAGFTYRPLTGDLASRTTAVQTIAFARGTSGDGFLFVGGRAGVFVTGPMSDVTNFVVKWKDMEPLPSSLLPNAYVYELKYVVAKDMLVAGTLGRSIQVLEGVSVAVEAPNVTCPTSPLNLVSGTMEDLAVLFKAESVQGGVADVTCQLADGLTAPPALGLANVTCTVENQLYGDTACLFKVYFGEASCGTLVTLGTDPDDDAICSQPYAVEAAVFVALENCSYTMELDLGDLAHALEALLVVPECAIELSFSNFAFDHGRKLLQQQGAEVTLLILIYAANHAEADKLAALLDDPNIQALLFAFFDEFADVASFNMLSVIVSSPSSATSDPHFVTPRGSAFDFNGRAGGSYCIVTDRDLQVNARFVGVADGGSSNATLAGTDDRTWIDQIAVLHGGDRVLVEAASLPGTPFAAPSGSIVVNGKVLPASKAGASTLALESGVTVTRRKTRVLVTIPEVAVIEVEVVRAAFWEVGSGPGRNFLNLKMREFKNTAAAHGVLGQSFPDKLRSAVEGSVDDYATSGIYSTDCRFNQFEGRQQI